MQLLLNSNLLRRQPRLAQHHALQGALLLAHDVPLQRDHLLQAALPLIIVPLVGLRRRHRRRLITKTTAASASVAG